MYQRIVLVMLAVVLPVDGVAQSRAFGAVTGLSSTLLATPANYFGRRTGFAAGASITLELGDWIALRAQALVHDKGSSGPGLFDMRVRYLETPLLVTVSPIRRTARIRPLLSVGVARAIELSCGGTRELGYFDFSTPTRRSRTPRLFGRANGSLGHGRRGSGRGRLTRRQAARRRGTALHEGDAQHRERLRPLRIPREKPSYVLTRYDGGRGTLSVAGRQRCGGAPSE